MCAYFCPLLFHKEFWKEVSVEYCVFGVRTTELEVVV